MTKAIPLEIRKIIVDTYEKGLDTRKHLAEVFQVTPRVISKLLKISRDGEDLNAKPHPGRPPLINEENMVVVKGLILSNPDKTLIEYCELVKRKLKIIIKKSAMSVICQKLDLRRKKKSFYAAEQDRPDVKKKRRLR